MSLSRWDSDVHKWIETYSGLTHDCKKKHIIAQKLRERSTGYAKPVANNSSSKPVGRILKKTWCEFCNRYEDLSHWSILVNPVRRPYLMCNVEVKMCNFSKKYEPLTSGWF